MDRASAAALDAYHRDESSDVDEQELLDSLDEEFEKYREQRMQTFASELAQAKYNKEHGYGELQLVDDEKTLMADTTGHDRCIVHFSQPSFARCRIMHEKLAVLAKMHLETKFMEIEASKAPFLVSRLGLQVLPCVLCYVKGVERLRLVGFERLGNKDTFAVETLERLLEQAGLVNRVSDGK